MRKMKRIAAWLLCCIFLAACGGGERENVEQSGPAASKDNAGQKEKDDTEAYYDTVTETEQFFDAQSLDWGKVMGTEKIIMRTTFLGMQFYQEEPVQLWSAVESDSSTMNVYLCMGNGSTRLLFSGLPKDYGYMDWFLDQEGNAYLFGYGQVKKLDPDGKVLYDRKSDFVSTKTICQLPDGSIYLLAMENGQSYKLVSLDPVSGSVSVVDNLGWSVSPQAVGVTEDGLLYMDQYGFWKLNLKEKTQSAFLLFEGTIYYESSDKLAIQAIRAGEDGSLRILRSDGRSVRSNGQKLSQGHGEVETLKRVNVADEKIPIVMRGIYLNDTWLKNQVVRFNQSQTDYYVVLDPWPEGSEVDDFIRRTGVEIATGKGPDILCGEWLGDIYSLVRKGVFEDLKPYMDRSGIREEDYFPLAFSSWRDGEKIYSVNVSCQLDGYRINEAVLGSRKEPDIGILMDALLAYEEDAFYWYHDDAQDLLEMFLEGSEDLWGMVDWANGTCDFSGELFAKILQVSRRYGYDERFSYPAVGGLRRCDIIAFDSSMEQEKEKMVTSGVLFDDGCHAGVNSFYGAMSINANSDHKEGAWAFLESLLGEEAQSAHDDSSLPVLKQAYDEIAAELLTHVNDENAESKQSGYGSLVNGEWIGVTRSLKDLTEEKVAELKATIQDARAYPIRTEPILDFIEEEAAYYFNGTKSIDEVRRIIENKVRLYLEEQSANDMSYFLRMCLDFLFQNGYNYDMP